MKTKQTLLVAGALTVMVLSAPLAIAQPALGITDLRGTVRIQQGVPCGDPVDVTTTVAEGRMEIAQRGREIVNPLFDLTRLDMFLTPFSVERDCLGIKASAEFSEIGLRLAGTVRFRGEATGLPESNQFVFRIPKEQFLIYESIVDNAPAPQPETRYQRPSEDVTGFIDLRRRTVQLHIVLTSQLHFRAGCVRDACRIDEIDGGTQTADILGVMPNAGATPPAVSCTPVNRSVDTFRVFADDDSDTPPIVRLGSYMLTIGEVIQLAATRLPGVRLIDTNRTDGIRHFQVGPGEAFIVATDSDGLSAFAFCR